MSSEFLVALTGPVGASIGPVAEEPEESGTPTGENPDTQPEISVWEGEGGLVRPGN